MDHSRLRPPEDVEHRKQYEAGWRYSQRDTATLDHGDAIDAPSPWYDGYLDYAVGRDKWHLAHCQSHNNSPTGCGQS